MHHRRILQDKAGLVQELKRYVRSLGALYHKRTSHAANFPIVRVHFISTLHSSRPAFLFSPHRQQDQLIQLKSENELVTKKRDAALRQKALTTIQRDQLLETTQELRSTLRLASEESGAPAETSSATKTQDTGDQIVAIDSALPTVSGTASQKHGAGDGLVMGW